MSLCSFAQKATLTMPASWKGILGKEVAHTQSTEAGS